MKVQRYPYIRNEYFGPAPGPGSERVGARRSERPCGAAAPAKLRRPGGGGREGRRARPGSRSGRCAQPGARLQPSSKARAGAPRPPVGGTRTRRRGGGGGAWLSAPGAGPDPGAPGRCRARLSGGSHRTPGHQGVRPPTGPAFPAAARPIRAAFTGGWAEPAQLLGGSGMSVPDSGPRPPAAPAPFPPGPPMMPPPFVSFMSFPGLGFSSLHPQLPSP
nr:collagen alpha-2(I) chain-like [Equus asinus]